MEQSNTHQSPICITNRFEGIGTRPLGVACCLEAINDNAMAISGLAGVLADLKNDAEGLTKEDAAKYPALAKIQTGFHDYPFLRAIEVLAEEIENRLTPVIDHLDLLERREAGLTNHRPASVAKATI